MMWKSLMFIFVLSLLILKSDLLLSKKVSGEFIKNSVNNWLTERNIEENVSLLSEVKYPDCNELVISNVSLNFSLIKVFCEEPNKWSIILRNKILKPKKIIKSKSSGERYNNDIIALKRDMNKGEIISSNDLHRVSLKISINKGIVLSKEEVIGKKLKNKVSANRQIYIRNLEKNWMIEKNSKIIFENSSKFISIKVDGIALENGDYNDKIRVKNISSGEILTGFVKNNKKVISKPKQF